MSESSLVVPERNKKGLRKGLTTGACAAAAARAATRCLILQETPQEIESILPNRQNVLFKLQRAHRLSDTEALASVIKDAGDDPDCTHGAEIIATVKLKRKQGIIVLNGQGVGTVTKPGLGLKIGAPSITVNPLKNITEMVYWELSRQSVYKGAEVIISVPNGELLARKTINARLGIKGGISILGTTGIVNPYSTAAFKSCVIKEIEVARAQKISDVIFTTGGKSEQFAFRKFLTFREEAFIQVGDFIGVGLRAAARCGMQRVCIAGMIGKLSKMADGNMQTHVSGSGVNMSFLAHLAKEAGASEKLCQDIRQANTARHVLELAARENISGLTDLVCRRVCDMAEKYVHRALEVRACLFDFNGALLAVYPKEGKGKNDTKKSSGLLR